MRLSRNCLGNRDRRANFTQSIAVTADCRSSSVRALRGVYFRTVLHWPLARPPSLETRIMFVRFWPIRSLHCVVAGRAVGCGQAADRNIRPIRCRHPAGSGATTADLPSDDEILRQIDEALEYTYRPSPASSVEHQAAWQIIHGRWPSSGSSWSATASRTFRRSITSWPAGKMKGLEFLRRATCSTKRRAAAASRSSSRATRWARGTPISGWAICPIAACRWTSRSSWRAEAHDRRLHRSGQARRAQERQSGNTVGR